MKDKNPFDFKKLKNIPRSSLLIAGLFGILLLVISLPVSKDKKADPFPIQGSGEQSVNTDTGQSDRISYQTQLARQLKQILSAMDGVGDVEVMITMKDSGERVLGKDISDSNESSTEEDSQGGKRNSTRSSSEEQTIHSGEGTTSPPFVTREDLPRVEGVLVAAGGGGDPVVVKNISEAIMALFPIEAHKIKVVKKM